MKMEIQLPKNHKKKSKCGFASLFTNEPLETNSNIQKLDASKQLIYTAFHIEEQKENYEVKIDIPVININGTIPTKFNNMTQTIFVNKAAEILNNQNTNKVIYSVSYAGFINGDILSLVIQSTLKEGSNPQRVIVQTYNYDMATGEEVKLVDLLAKRNIIQSDASKKINDIIQKAKEDAQTLVQSGYTVYNRDLNNKMYQLENITTYFLGTDGELYIIFAYGNNNFTSEMDIVLYE